MIPAETSAQTGLIYLRKCVNDSVRIQRGSEGSAVGSGLSHWQKEECLLQQWLMFELLWSNLPAGEKTCPTGWICEIQGMSSSREIKFIDLSGLQRRSFPSPCVWSASFVLARICNVFLIKIKADIFTPYTPYILYIYTCVYKHICNCNGLYMKLWRQLKHFIYFFKLYLLLWEQPHEGTLIFLANRTIYTAFLLSWI